MTKIEELEKQVDEMKVTIELMKAEEAKSKKFQFKYPEECYLVNTTEVHMGGVQNPAFLEHGRYRLTEEAAKQSLVRNKRANRLEALAEYLGGLKEFEYGKDSYYIYRSSNSNIWETTVASKCFYPESVYMTEECAKEICRMLNNGEFEL